MTATWTTKRTARKPRRCAGCDAAIRPGDRYLQHTAAPGGELGYEKWQRMSECSECAARYGRSVTS